jgi:hypothetical protein
MSLSPSAHDRALFGARSSRYAWDMSGYLRAGGTLAQLLGAFQDRYRPIVRHRNREPRPAGPVAAAATFCKQR